MTEGASASLSRVVARLVVAMMIADDRLASGEIDAAARLDRTGLGPLTGLVDEELERAVREPIDVGSACAALAGTGSALAGAVLTVLARIAISDGSIDPHEAKLFAMIAERLGVEDSRLESYLPASYAVGKGPAVAPAPRAPAAHVASPAHAALHALGLGPEATVAEIDAAYLAAVDRYDPVRVAPLGVEFAVLAVRKLAALTDLYQTATASAVRAA